MGHLRKPGESDLQFAIRRVFETGQLWAPNNPDGANVTPADLPKLSAADSVVKQGVVGLQRMMVTEYAPRFALKLGAMPDMENGDLDPAILEVMGLPRCDVPDHAPPPGAHFQFEDPDVQQVAEIMQAKAAAPAVGQRGNWPRCHGIGDFHSCFVQVSMANRPAWATDAVMKPVWKNVQTAYAEIGQWITYVGQDMKNLLTGEDHTGQHVDTKASWARSSSGWIGLAILTLDLDCRQEIWQQYLATYQGGQSDEARITQQSSLWRHEHGHNSGLQHTNGGTMNPSIVNNLPTLWVPGDPSTPVLKRHYGGVPYVPPGGGGGGGGGGTPPPGPTDPWQKRIVALEAAQFEDNIKNTLQDVRDQLFDARLKKLEARP